MNILEIAEMQDARLNISYRTRFHDWTCSFDYYSTKDGIMLRGNYGEGKTPLAAIADFVEKNKGMTLVCLGEHRKEFVIPFNTVAVDKL